MTDTPSQSRKPKNPERYIGNHQLDPAPHPADDHDAAGRRGDCAR